MGFNSGPEGPSFGFEEESGISEMERLDLMQELAGQIEASSHKISAERINQDPILHAMLGKVVEGGPELDPIHVAHLRKMIALRMCGLSDMAARAARDQEFYGLALQTVQDEIEELRAIPGADDLPDMWDVALQDLLGLEGEE
jgi:hypothetical protein